jgi:TonB family protein
MQRALLLRIRQHKFFWRNKVFWLPVSVLLHVLLFMSFFVGFTWQTEPVFKPEAYVPAYVYQQPTPPAEVAPSSTVASHPTKVIPTAKTGIEKPVTTSAEAIPAIPSLKELKAVTFSKKVEKVQDDVRMIGDKKMDAPLLKLLGKALSQHLRYPRVAVDFNVTGLVTIGFLLYPDGHLTNIQLVHSSSADVLDSAALAAVKAMSPVIHVDSFLDKPKYLVVGVLFG